MCFHLNRIVFNTLKFQYQQIVKFVLLFNTHCTDTYTQERLDSSRISLNPIRQSLGPPSQAEAA